MKKILVFLFGLTMLFGLTSCVTAVQAQDDTYIGSEVNSTVVITYGTPYIVDGMIMYYVYKGLYYYPYWVNDMYCFHVYRHPIVMDYYRRYYRPVPRDFYRHHRYDPTPRRHRPDQHYYYHNGRNHHLDNVRRPDIHHRPSGNRPMNRPSGTSNRPHNNIGTNTRPHGNMGGRPSGSHGSSTRMGGRR